MNINPDENKIIYIPVTNILPSPYQPRTTFDMTSLRELAQSIKTYGILNPVTVRIINGRTYELVSGERRWRAAKLAGLENIPAITVNVNDNDAAIIALVENLQRQDLNFFEEAEGYNNIMEDYNITQEELAYKVGKSQSAISNKLRLLRLPDSIRKLILENELTERHARAFLKIPSKSVMEEIVHRTINESLSVKKTEQLIDATLEELREAGAETAIRKKFGDVRIINNTVKKAVELMKKSGVEADYDVEQTDECFRIIVTIPYK